jgi:hypothetical protein
VNLPPRRPAEIENSLHENRESQGARGRIGPCPRNP